MDLFVSMAVLTKYNSLKLSQTSKTLKEQWELQSP